MILEIKEETNHMNYNLDRFISAQEDNYIFALEEIKSGFKRSHWMWYIFHTQSMLVIFQ